ncbi:acyl-CoA N-acyltransferase [Tricladium varicosporioides]|nr:acyl-CoA N-acyltransferase [Hymenoscyphus varicosporioides]
MASPPTHRNIPKNNPVPVPKPAIIIRPMQLTDTSHLARITALAYANTPVERFLSPLAGQYPGDIIRGHKQSIRRRLLSSRSYSVVACLKSEEGVERVVGFSQLMRLGEDEGAREWVKSHGILKRLSIFILGWFFHYFVKIQNWLFPAKAFSNEALAMLGKWSAEDNKIHWDATAWPERQKRWFVATLVVDPKYQNLGIGRRLMQSGMAIAQREKTIMGLIASPAGERLYLKLGWEKLGEFCHRIPNDDKKGGGVFIWYPEGVYSERYKSGVSS